MAGGSNALYRAIRRQFEATSRPRPTRVSHVLAELPYHARDPCYRFDLDGRCRRGAGCPFRHRPASDLTRGRPQPTPIRGTSLGDSGDLPNCGTTRVLFPFRDVSRIHDGGVPVTSRPTSSSTQARVGSAEASVATALRLDFHRRARQREVIQEDVELCGDEYVYDEEALRQALTDLPRSQRRRHLHPWWRGFSTSPLPVPLRWRTEYFCCGLGRINSHNGSLRTERCTCVGGFLLFVGPAEHNQKSAQVSFSRHSCAQ